MQINLKQTEIVAALKQYITQQGINLAGKTVTVDFTAGRKESGISAEIDIVEPEVPDFFEEGHTLYVVQLGNDTGVVEAASPVEVKQDPQPEAEGTQASAAVSPTTSLFGG